jgi:2-polyprenyl-3-methyl-5-hydroxy-6-metoxy-1,4-benzoquinol methylase
LKCPLCSSEKTEQTFKKLKSSITSDSEMIDGEVSNVICTSCGFVFNETGARHNVSTFYSNSYKLMELSSEAEFKFYSKYDSIPYSDWRLHVLTNNIPLKNRGSILDIGCGKGNFLLQFSKNFSNWSLYGIEASKNALMFAKEKLPNVHLHEGLFEKNVYDKKFDLIVTLGVVEHLEDPNSFLARAISCLKEDGVIFLDVPNFKLNPADLFVYDHLNHFTRETLTNLLNNNGLEIVKIIETPDRLPLFAICKKSQKKKILANNYSYLKRIILDHIQFNESMFRTYQEANKKYDKIGVFGLGIMIWVGIQNGILNKEKIESFFDENDLLIGNEKDRIKIRSLEEITKFQNLPLVFSLSPCYIQNILPKLDEINAKYLIPHGYEYYKKYF